MRAITTNIAGVLLLKPDVYKDQRGFFMETYTEEKYFQEGVENIFVQDNYSHSKQDVLRGLHFQLKKPQGKLVRVIKGTVFDVALDVRLGSPTFGHHFSILLDDQDFHQLFLPPGLAHGFCVISEFADFEYKCTDYYHPESEQGIAWDDPDLNIDWSIAEIAEKISLSDKDKQNVKLKDQPAEKLPAYKDFMTEVEMRAES